MIQYKYAEKNKKKNQSYLDSNFFASSGGDAHFYYHPIITITVEKEENFNQPRITILLVSYFNAIKKRKN